MLRSYTGKRTLSRRWIKHAHDIHQEKLKNMRPAIDSACPHEFSHLKSKAKKEQQREGKKYADRFTEIEKANRILLEKMSNIMKNKQNSSIPFRKKSLNKEVRKKNLEKIAGDNQAIVKRLQCRTPVYSAEKWEREWKENEKRVKNLCEYPYKCPAARARV